MICSSCLEQNWALLSRSKDRAYKVPDLRREVGNRTRFHHPIVGCRGCPTEYVYPHCTAARESLPHLQSCKPYPTFYSMSSHVHYSHTWCNYLIYYYLDPLVSFYSSLFIHLFNLKLISISIKEEDIVRRYFLQKKKRLHSYTIFVLQVLSVRTRCTIPHVIIVKILCKFIFNWNL